MPGTVQKQPVILLVEDEEADVFFMRRALSSIGFPGDVRVVVNAWQARDYMEGKGQYSDRVYYPSPDLILCDLHMPGATGLDFLKWLREHILFKQIPVVIWSGSIAGATGSTLLDAGANAYFLKTPDFQKLRCNAQTMLYHLSLTPEEAASACDAPVITENIETPATSTSNLV